MEIGLNRSYYFMWETPIASKERTDSFRSLRFRKYVLFYFVSVGVTGVGEYK